MEDSLPTMPAQSASAVIQDVAPSTPSLPKRRPGRPKGSGKKPLPNPTIISDKIKRPVGRPRKDGLPAGSVSPRKASRRSSAKINTEEPHLPPPFPGAYYPQHPGIPPPWQGFPPPHPSPSMGPNGSAVTKCHPPTIDPDLNRDEWAELARSRPDLLTQAVLEAIAAPNPIASGGPSVEEAFKSHLASLMPSQNQTKDAHPIPSLYSVLRTLWLPSSPSYLSLIAPRTTARGTHSEHRFLYWDPLPLVLAGIHCTTCGGILQNRGRIRSGPVKVYDIDKPFFIIGCEYVCKSASCVTNDSPEGRKFASTDASVMRGLPPRLREEFPARLSHGESDLGSEPDVWDWHAAGVSKLLWNMVIACLKVGIPKENIIQVMNSIQNPPTDERREHDQDDEAENADIFRADIDSHHDMADKFGGGWKANISSADAGNHSSVPRQTSSSASVAPDLPVASSSASVQPQLHPPQAQVQTQFTFGHPGPYVYYPGHPYYPPPPHNQSAPPPGPHAHMSSEPNGLKRTYGFEESGSDLATLEPSQKRTRHCCKCGSQDCKGKGGRSFCGKTCQDCGKLDCRGRNSRRPDKACSEAWN